MYVTGGGQGKIGEFRIVSYLFSQSIGVLIGKNSCMSAFFHELQLWKS